MVLLVWFNGKVSVREPMDGLPPPQGGEGDGFIGPQGTDEGTAGEAGIDSIDVEVLGRVETAGDGRRPGDSLDHKIDGFPVGFPFENVEIGMERGVSKAGSRHRPALPDGTMGAGAEGENEGGDVLPVLRV